MGARARQQWRYGNYRIHPSRASHLATPGDYGVIESRSEAFGDGFLSVAALWINLGKRGQKKSGLSFQSPEEHLREAGMCIQERVAYCRVGQTPRRGAAKALELEERKTVRENHAIQRNRTEETDSTFGSLLVQNYQSGSLDRGHEDAAILELNNTGRHPFVSRSFGRSWRIPLATFTLQRLIHLYQLQSAATCKAD